MKFFNIYYESGERVDGQVTNRKLVNVHSYIDFGNGKVTKFVYANLEGVKEKTINEKRFDVVIKEYSKGDCISIHLIMIPKINLSEVANALKELLEDLVKDSDKPKKKMTLDELNDMVD